MFETYAQARLQNPFFVLEEGAQRSAFISLTPSDEWFFVTYETVDEKISSQQQFMVSTVRSLLALSFRDGPEQFIHQVQVVTPPWLNSKGGWSMDPLCAIYAVDERVVCYELVNGEIYPSELREQSRELLWSKESRTN